MITVEVGNGAETQIFSVQQDFLCYYSPYFRVACERSSQEEQTNNLIIKEHHPAVFGTLLNWIFTQRLEDLNGELPKAKTLIRLWVLADKLLVPELQNLVIDAINKRVELNGYVQDNMCSYIYENTVKGSQLRRLLVSHVAWRLKSSCLTVEGGHTREMLIDLACHLKDWIKQFGTHRPIVNVKDFYVNTNGIDEK